VEILQTIIQFGVVGLGLSLINGYNGFLVQNLLFYIVLKTLYTFKTT